MKEHLQHNSTVPRINTVDDEQVLKLLEQVDMKITREKSQENEAMMNAQVNYSSQMKHLMQYKE